MLAIVTLLSGCFWIAPGDHSALIQSLDDSAPDTGDTDTACTTTTWYRDGDDDGYGNVDDTREACDQPDGYAVYSTDCNDADGTIHPGADEVCDDVDQDCDHAVDEDAVDAPTWYTDADTDGEGDPTTAVALCDAPAGAVDNGDDCDDDAVGVWTGAVEVCNGLDDDCDGLIDDDDDLAPVVDTSTGSTFYADVDGDGFGDAASTVQACAAPDGYGTDATDCDDTRSNVNPAAIETCDDGLDDDCDHLADDADDSTDTATMTAWYADADGDGDGPSDGIATYACLAPSGAPVTTATDCDDTDALVHPGAVEICDALDTDEDCNTLADDADAGVDATTRSGWYADGDGDGYGDLAAAPTAQCDASAAAPAPTATDCDDTDDTVNPGATETCNSVDDDCDGLVDDDDDTLDTTSLPLWYVDADRDGLGDPATATPACTAPLAYVASAGDCNDYDALVTDTAYQVSYVSSSGAVTDLTAAFAGGTAAAPYDYTFTENSGELRVCAGHWYATVDMGNYAYGTLQGYGAREDVILDASATGSVVSCGNCVMTIAGLTLTGGYATQGGGVNISNGGRMTIDDAVITANTATYDGGGLGGNIGGPTYTVTDSVISDNSGGSIGGGIGTLGGIVSVTDTDFSGNTATQGGGIGEGYGGGSITITGGTFSGNSASSGGAVANYSGTTTVTDATFTDNTAGYGGAFALVSGNDDSGVVTLTGAVFTDNTASSYGGAVFLQSGTLTITDCELSYNSARYGGGLALQPGTSSVPQATCTGDASTSAGFWGNLASSKGGGVYVDGAAGFTSDACDFDGLGSNNPSDVLTWDGATDSSYNYGDDASFACVGTSGCL